ncbi:hypothetical protein BK796_04995 [Kosakonia pseudosacchari]|uniref:Secreted protein n=1 Tax=Kosakonia pseudosacchari TaxID=1646340 RepID=A0ABX4ITS4_9ENTR|nr:hypothetical protein BK796_04995 [Kosakonia pseudosacchari]
MLIFASISFLLPPTLTIQLPGLLMCIKYIFTYHLMGRYLIFIGFYKSRITLAFMVCRICVQKKRVFARASDTNYLKETEGVTLCRQHRFG